MLLKQERGAQAKVVLRADMRVRPHPSDLAVRASGDAYAIGALNQAKDRLQQMVAVLAAAEDALRRELGPSIDVLRSGTTMKASLRAILAWIERYGERTAGSTILAEAMVKATRDPSFRRWTKRASQRFRSAILERLEAARDAGELDANLDLAAVAVLLAAPFIDVLALRGGAPYLAWGSPGGDQQDQWIAQFFLRHVHAGMNLQEAIDAPAWHSEHFAASFWPREARPGVLVVEGRLGEATIKELRRRGHEVEVGPDWSEGRLTAASRVGKRRRAAANPRGMQGYAAGR